MSQTRKHNKAGFESWCLPFMINDWSQIGWVRESEVPLEVALKMPQLKKNYCNINLRKKKLCWNVKVKKDLGVFKCCLEEILIKVKMSCSFRVMGIEGGYWTKAVLPGGLRWRWPMPAVGSGQWLDHSVSPCLWGKPAMSLSQPLKPGNVSQPKLCFDYMQALRWPAPDLPTAPLRTALKLLLPLCLLSLCVEPLSLSEKVSTDRTRPGLWIVGEKSPDLHRESVLWVQRRFPWLHTVV